MRAWRVIAAIAVLGGLGACSDATSGQPAASPNVPVVTPGGTSTPTTETTAGSETEPTGEPPTEGTNPESAQPRQSKPSISIAQLPVGGVPAGDNCNPVSWLGGSIPPGTTITLGTPRFDPDHIFVVDQSACPGGTQSCKGLRWTADEQPQCSVGFKQVGDTGRVVLVVPAEAICATQADCDTLKKLGLSEIELTAQAPQTPESSASPPTPSESPSETPSGAPSETLSGNG